MEEVKPILSGGPEGYELFAQKCDLKNLEGASKAEKERVMEMARKNLIRQYETLEGKYELIFGPQKNFVGDYMTMIMILKKKDK